MMTRPTRKWLLPHTYVLLFALIAIAATLTWLLPSGAFERQAFTTPAGQVTNTVVPGTFVPVDKVTEERDLRQGFFDVLSAPAEGMVHAADVVAFVLVLGGAFGIITGTGALDRGLHALANSLADKGILVIPIMMVLLSLGGSTFGMSEEIIALYPVVISLMFVLRFDSMTAVLILFLGTQAGYIGATINPFSVTLAQAIAEIPGNPLLGLRAVAWVVFTGLAIAYTMRYARRVRLDAACSPVMESDLRLREIFEVSGDEHPEFHRRDRFILAAFVLTLVIISWGLLTHGWYMAEIAAAFLALGLASGAAAGMSPSTMAENFVEGLKEFVYAAFVIGLARGILVIAEAGMIVDPLLDSLGQWLAGIPTWAFTTLVLVANNVITFFVPSSSGEAALTMPVLAPLADLVGVNRDSLVLAYQFGNGLTNLISPTNGLLLAGLAITRIRFSQWFRVILPWFLVAWPVAAVVTALSASL
jgi:uncharacterized ion transporter superfamily protein YfcC